MEEYYVNDDSIENEEKYTKDILKSSEKFRNYCDVIDALLAEDEEYSISETEDIIEKFMKGEV